MKKFLSLVLALVMTMSLVTVSAGAKDFTDDDTATYKEAIDVMSEIGVIDGYTDGSFGPKGSLTRGAAAKIICNLIMGPTQAATLQDGTKKAPFPDVPKDHTFAGYIAFCAEQGIICGYNDGYFRPANRLTGYAFLKMLLGALGYDAQIEDMQNTANWGVNVAKLANNAGLFNGLKGEFKGNQITREQACLFALNMLQANCVKYDSHDRLQDVRWEISGAKQDGNIPSYGPTFGEGAYPGNSGLPIWGGNVGALEPNYPDYNGEDGVRGHRADGFIQFAEQHFPLLVLNRETDDFMRPVRRWINNGRLIGDYALEATAEYHDAVSVDQIYQDLDLNRAVTADNVNVFVDGDVTGITGDPYGDGNDLAMPWHVNQGENLQPATKIARNNKDEYGAKGVLTQVFLFKNTPKFGENSVLITEINTWNGTAVRNTAADKNEEAYVTILTNGPQGQHPFGTGSYLQMYTNETFKEGERVNYTYSFKPDDWRVQNMPGKEDDFDRVGVCSIKTAESKTGVVAKVVNDAVNGDVNTKIVLDGKEYEYSNKHDGIKTQDLTINNTYTAYFDNYGNIIYIDEGDAIASNYAMLLNYRRGDNFNDAQALLLTADGEEVIVTIPAKDFDKLPLGTVVTWRENHDVYYLRGLNTVATNRVYDTHTTHDVNQNHNQWHDNCAWAFSNKNVTRDFELTQKWPTIKFNDVKVFDANRVDSNEYVRNNGTTSFIEDEASRNVTADERTLFVIDNGTQYTTYTGIENVPSINGKGLFGKDHNNFTVNAVAYTEDNLAKVVFIFADKGAIDDQIQNMVFLTCKPGDFVQDGGVAPYVVYNGVKNNALDKDIKISADVKVLDATGKVLNTDSDDAVFDKAYLHLNGLFAVTAEDEDGVIYELQQYKEAEDPSTPDSVRSIIALNGAYNMLNPVNGYYGWSHKNNGNIISLGIRKPGNVTENYDYYRTVRITPETEMFYVDDDEIKDVTGKLYLLGNGDPNDRVFALIDNDGALITLVIDKRDGTNLPTVTPELDNVISVLVDFKNNGDYGAYIEYFSTNNDSTKKLTVGEVRRMLQDAGATTVWSSSDDKDFHDGRTTEYYFQDAEGSHLETPTHVKTVATYKIHADNRDYFAVADEAVNTAHLRNNILVKLPAMKADYFVKYTDANGAWYNTAKDFLKDTFTAGESIVVNDYDLIQFNLELNENAKADKWEIANGTTWYGKVGGTNLVKFTREAAGGDWTLDGRFANEGTTAWRYDFVDGQYVDGKLDPWTMGIKIPAGAGAVPVHTVVIGW